jgi:hypothetical protein
MHVNVIDPVTVTPGSAEKHVLEGDFTVVRNDFKPDFKAPTGFTMPTPIPADRGNIVAFVVPEGKKAFLKHPVHPTVELEAGFHISSIQVEYNPLGEGEDAISDAWD